MTFATEKEKQASERFMLVRVTGHRDITDDLITHSGFIKKVILNKKPSKVLRWTYLSGNPDPPSGIALTEDTSYPPGINQWVYDDSISTLYILDTPDDNAYTVEEQLFFTGSQVRHAPAEPTTPGDYVTWLPLITEYPSITESIDNLTVGIFSISDTQVSIINEGNWLGDYVLQNTSLYDQEVKIWQCINDVTNIRRVFTGATVSADLSGKVVTLSVADRFNKLSKRASFGLRASQMYCNKNYDGYGGGHDDANFNPNDVGKNIPRHLQVKTKYNFGTNIGTVGDTSKFYTGFYYAQSTFKRYLCGYIKSGLTTNNNITTQSFGTITATSLPSAFVREFVVTSYSNLYYNQTITWVESAVTYHGIIAELVNSTTFRVFRLGADAASTGSTFTARKAFSCYFREGNDTINMVQGRDYTVNDSNGVVVITLVTGFESNFTQFSSNPFDPYRDVLKYYYYVDTNLGHATILKNIIEASGVATNAASFTAAASALSANAHFSIPFNGSGEIQSYADYVAKILESTGGFIRVNSSDEVEYQLFQAPVPTVIIDDSEYSDMQWSVEFQDVIPEINATNDQLTDGQVNNSGEIWAGSRYHSFDSEGSRLNNVLRVKYIDHVLKSFTNSASRVLRMNSIRRLKYKFNAPAKFFDMLLGDDIRIYSDQLPGGADYVDAKVVLKSLNGSNVTIEAVDLPNL